VLVDGNVIVVLSVPAKVNVLLTESVLAFVTVSVPVEDVMVRPLMEVAVATPRTGVTRVGVVARTMLPEPVVVLPRAVTVPLVGNVSVVVPVTVNVVANAPESVNAPPKLTALPPILPTVVATEPAVLVTSPVSAGKAAVGKVDAAAAAPAEPVPIYICDEVADGNAVLMFAVVASVPDVGNVNDVVPLTVKVVAKLPLMVSVLAALLAIPVPPYAGPMMFPFHVADVIEPGYEKVLVDQDTFAGAPK